MEKGPSVGQTVAAQVKRRQDGGAGGAASGEETNELVVEFAAKMAGEHRIHVAHQGHPVAGSPFHCKVYDVAAIKVKEASKGVVGKPVTFLGKFLHFFEWFG